MPSTPKKVLVADDDFDNRSILAQALASSGYAVVLACDGEEALAVAAREKPDLIFMDLSMPRLDGLEAARRLKSDPATSGVPIFAFTAHAFDEDRRKAAEAGCDDYIAKPCYPLEVVKRARARLEGPR